MARFSGGFLAFKALLARFKPCFGFGCAFLFLGDRVNFGFLDAEILHQRNIARADPGAGATLNAVGQVVGFRFIVDLPFAVPVELLRQQIRRAGIGTGAAANTAFLFLLFAHLADGRSQQAVGDFYHRDIQPRQGKAHQRPTHNYHLLSARAEPGLIQQMTNRRAQTRPDVAGTANRFTGKGNDALGKRLAVNNGTFNGIGGADVLHQDANVRRTTAVRDLLAG